MGDFHMFHWIAILLATSTAHAFMNSDQVIQEFQEPGHIPQGLKPVKYHPLEQVISKATQVKMKARKQKSQKADIAAILAPPQDLADTVDLRQWDSPIRVQFGSTCTANSLIATMENVVNRQLPKSFLSARYLWNQYRQYSADVAIRTAAKYAQIDNVYWPQNSVNPVASNLAAKGKYQLTDYEDLQSDTDAVLKALSQGNPVYIAMQVPSDMASCRSTIRYSTRLVNGGHALEVVGYQLDDSIPGDGYFILKNSWGTTCGDKGYQYLPIGLCDRNDMYCLFWSIKKVTVK